MACSRVHLTLYSRVSLLLNHSSSTSGMWYTQVGRPGVFVGIKFCYLLCRLAAFTGRTPSTLCGVNSYSLCHKVFIVSRLILSSQFLYICTILNLTACELFKRGLVTDSTACSNSLIVCVGKIIETIHSATLVVFTFCTCFILSCLLCIVVVV